MNCIKRLMRRMATAIVTYYYNRLYRKAVKIADERHKKEKETFYVIDHFIQGQTLSVINRKGFRLIKHAAQELHRDPIYWTAEYGTPMLRKQAWYHTPDGSEKQALSELEKEARRIAFIRSGLRKAKLL